VLNICAKYIWNFYANAESDSEIERPDNPAHHEPAGSVKYGLFGVFFSLQQN
jgi:hypothetical protein